MVTNEKKLSNKKVRLSLAEDNVVPPAAIQVDLPDIAREEEKFGDFLKRNSSTQSSTSSIFSGPRRTSRIPSFLLNTLHDKKLLIQHVIWFWFNSNWFLSFEAFQSLNMVAIEIVSLSLVEDSELLKSDEVKYLYVEYSFLGYKGHLLETQSLPQPTKPDEDLFYRFKQKFEINPEDNEKQLQMLQSMLSKDTKKQIKFFVVSEPIESEDKDCDEVGWA